MLDSTPLKHARLRFARKITNYPVLHEIVKIIAIIVGALSVAIGLEMFLVPNGFMDGGVTGLAIILTNYINVPLGVFIGLLNIPFLVVAYRLSGWQAALRTTLGIGVLSVATIILQHFPPLTHEFILALGYGGVLLGFGVGLALRYGGALDGTEIFSVSLSDKINAGVDQIILTINFFVFLAAAFVFTPDKAMGSFLLFYIVVTPIIKKVMEGGSELKTVQILSTQHAQITDRIHRKLNKKVVLLDGHRDDLDTASELKVLFTFVARFEESALVDMVESIDPKALIVFTDVASIRGRTFNKNRHH